MIIIFSSKMASTCSILLMVLTVINSGVCIEQTFTYGNCQSGKENCSDCYLTLKKSLLGSDENIQNLSVAFFPPKDNLPEFVTVTYCFDDNCLLQQNWFWTHDSSYSFFPIKTFQYLSLFFGKPAEFFSRTVQLRLDEECHNASVDMFTLLTQRVSYSVLSMLRKIALCILVLS